MCEKCDYTGVIHYFEWVPYGSTNVAMPVTETCDCLLDGNCPVCGETLTEQYNDEPGGLYCHYCERGWEI